jgi:hypothetical protein
VTSVPLSLEALQDLGPTGFRACVIAFGMALNGQEVSLSEVARQTGVSRQALHKSHPRAVEFVAWVRSDWVAPARPALDSVANLRDQLADSNRRLRNEKSRRRAAEQQRDRALHHLELATATLELMDRPQAPVRRLPTRSK